MKIFVLLIFIFLLYVVIGDFVYRRKKKTSVYDNFIDPVSFKPKSKDEDNGR